MEEDTKVSSATQGPVIQLPGDLCERSFGRVLGVDAVVCSYQLETDGYTYILPNSVFSDIKFAVENQPWEVATPQKWANTIYQGFLFLQKVGCFTLVITSLGRGEIQLTEEGKEEREQR